MMAEKIRLLLKVNGWSVPMLAKALETTSQNLYNKLGRDNFSEKELIEIADVLGYDLKVNFISRFGEGEV